MINNPTAVGTVSNRTGSSAETLSVDTKRGRRTGSSAETLDMDNPENLIILKILVQTILNKINHANTR